MSYTTQNGIELDPMAELLEQKFQEYCLLEEEFQQNPASFTKSKLDTLNSLRQLMVQEMPDRFY